MRVAGLVLISTLVGCSSFRGTANASGDAGDDAQALDSSVDGGADANPSSFTIFREAADSGALRGVWGSGPNDVHMAGEKGVLLQWNGGDWVEFQMGKGLDLYGVWGSGTTEAYAVGTFQNQDRGAIFRREQDRWIAVPAPNIHGLRAVWGTGDMRYAVGLSGAIYSGPSAQPFTTGVQVDAPPEVPPTTYVPILHSVSGNSPASVMIAGDVDTTFFYDGTWHTYLDPVDRTRTFRAMWAMPGPEIDVYQGANYFGLWRFHGKTKPVEQLNEEKDLPQNVERFIYGIWGLSSDQIVCVGSGGRIMTFDTKSGRVRVRPSPTGKTLYGIWGTSLDDIWIVGEGGLVLRGRIEF